MSHRLDTVVEVTDEDLSECAVCGATTLRAWTESGSELALDPDPGDDGNWLAERAEDGRLTLRLLPPRMLDPGAYVAHRLVCPGPAEKASA